MIDDELLWMTDTVEMLLAIGVMLLFWPAWILVMVRAMAQKRHELERKGWSR